MATQPSRQQRRAESRPQSSTATRSRTTSTRKTTGGAVKPFNMPLENKNIMIIVAGVVTITLGYFLMSSDSVMGSLALNISPMILLIGYLVVIPYGIMYGSSRKKKKGTSPLIDQQTS